MTLSIVLTVHDRSPQVSAAVAESLRESGADQLVVVLDRTLEASADGARAAYGPLGAEFVELSGTPGWLCPARAWNAGFRAASSEFIYCLSSETIQAAGNVARTRALIADGHTVLHGKAECSCGPKGTEVDWGGTAPGNLLGDAAHARPLGFIWAAPLASVRKAGGFDEEFMSGLWYDDNDFFLRLWQTGLDFLFDDSVAGVHQHHERPGLIGPEAQAKILANRNLMLRKHGTLDPWLGMKRRTKWAPGWTRWSHVA